MAIEPSPDMPRCFEDFYLETVERTLRTARHLAGDQDTARDATQEAYVVMLRCWRERRFRSIVDNGRYVVGIMAHKVADSYRHGERFLPAGNYGDHQVAELCFENTLDQLSIFKAVRGLLEDQPARRRMIGILFFLEEFDYLEIAEILGITASTVRTQVERLRARLRPLVNSIRSAEEAGEQR